MNKLRQGLAIATASSLPFLAAAQPATLDPAQAKAATPPLRYQSAYADYKPWQELKPADWRAVNDRLRDAVPASGAHAGHAMPAAAAASAPAPKAASPAAPTGHEGHSGGKK